MIISYLNIADCAAWGARLDNSAAHAVAMEIIALELTD
jgi:hypothetical protein